MRSTTSFWARSSIFSVLLVLLFSIPALSQNPSPAKKVTKIDEKIFAELIKPGDKPLLINFWATWCVPCVEEFPDLVKIDNEYRGKIDFITVTLDFEEELDAAVPKFLAEMKAEMPTYLLVTPDETAAIRSVSKDWQGGLPFTVLYKPNGEIAYSRQGIVKHDVLTGEIDKLLGDQQTPAVAGSQILELPILRRDLSYQDGVAAAQKDIAEGRYSLFLYGLVPSLGNDTFTELKEKYSLEIRGSGCFVPIEGEKYVWGYNSTVKEALVKKHGTSVLEKTSMFASSDPRTRTSSH